MTDKQPSSIPYTSDQAILAQLHLLVGLVAVVDAPVGERYRLYVDIMAERARAQPAPLARYLFDFLDLLEWEMAPPGAASWTPGVIKGGKPTNVAGNTPRQF